MWGVESICAALCELGVNLAPSMYYEYRKLGPTKRNERDEKLKGRSPESTVRTSARTVPGRCGCS